MKPFPPTDITITDMGCWADNDTKRIMPEGLPNKRAARYWECAHHAAMLGQGIIGLVRRLKAR